jgi:hypothetical protein
MNRYDAMKRRFVSVLNSDDDGEEMKRGFLMKNGD